MVKQGDVYWCEVKNDKTRPVLILTRTPAISFLNSITIAPITSANRELPTYVFLDQLDGMPRECSVSLDNIQTHAKSRFGDYITTLSRERMLEVKEAIGFAFGFDGLEEEF